MKIFDIMNQETLIMDYEKFKEYLIEVIENDVFINREYEEESKKVIEEIRQDKNIKEIAEKLLFEIEE